MTVRYRLVGIALMLMVFAGAPSSESRAGKEPDPEPPVLAKEGILGVWVAKNAELPKGSTIEFRKGGKLTIKVKPPGMNAVPIQGTWKVAGKKLDIVTLDANGEGSEWSAKIKRLTKKELVLVDKKRQTEFSRK
jgi:uncharacterized protein (TIGR03066 family)